MNLRELERRGFLFAPDGEGGGAGGDGEGGDGGDGDGGAGGGQFSEEVLDSLAERLTQRMAAKAGGDGGQGGDGGGQGGDGDGTGNAFLDEFASGIEQRLLNKMAPMLRGMASGNVRSKFQNIPAELLPVIETAFGNIPGAQLAAMMEQGGDILLAQAAIGQAYLGGKLPGFTPPTGEGIGGGHSQQITDELRQQIAGYKAITGKDPTMAELKEWGYIQ